MTKSASPKEYPWVIGQFIADCLPGMLEHQRPDGSIIYKDEAPVVYPQQAIFPLAFLWAGMDPEKRYLKSKDVNAAIGKLGGYLVQRFNDKGEFEWDSYGTLVKAVDQRLTYAWVEGLRILRENGADHDYERWSQKIQLACDTLISHRLEKLKNVRRFIGRVMGTSTNHVALYLSTIYRAGKVLNRPDLVDFVLPIARRLAEDIHPDGYWAEHEDLARNGGPTPSYNYLTHNFAALMYEWTGEPVFRAAIEKSSRFHTHFIYPDGTFFDLIDERVRYSKDPRTWGLFAFTHTPSGRAVAMQHFERWSAMQREKIREVSPELLARYCENYMYWKSGEVDSPPAMRPNHAAVLSLPAGIFRRGSWCLGVSAIPAMNPQDPGYIENPFALDRQKLFSVWHEMTGLIIDGSNAKKQPENSAFSTEGEYAKDWFPIAGAIGEENGALVSRATFKSFYGEVRLVVLSDSTLQMTLKADLAACPGPVICGFTFWHLAKSIAGLNGIKRELDANRFELTAEDLGGGFEFGKIRLSGPADFKVHWPYEPFNSYAKGNKCFPGAELLRVSAQLTHERPSVQFILTVNS